MKKLVLFIVLMLSVAQAKNVQEGYKVTDFSEKTLLLLKSRPEFTLDHIKNNQLEIYGPRGLGTFLQKNGISFTALETATDKTKSAYPTPEEIEKELKSVTAHYPGIMRMFSIGKSSRKRDLWVIKISKNVNVDDKRPEFKFIANMHGDEIVGREMMVRLIKDLAENYGKDKQITHLLDKVQIYIMPSMNPDGAAQSTRGNGRYVDLNRDFPDFSTSDNVDTHNGREPETQAVMNWQKNRRFVLSANFHGGAEVVNYPWDTVAEAYKDEYKVKEMSLEYAGLVPYIGTSTAFDNGITNGYAWYEVNGGMQDWSIHYRNDLQITIEVSDEKWPDYNKVGYYYEQNRPGLLRFMERALN